MNTVAPKKSTKAGATGRVLAKPGKKNATGKPGTVEQRLQQNKIRQVRIQKNYETRQTELHRLSAVAAAVVPGIQPGASDLSLFPSMRLTPEQFQVVATLIRSRDPSRAAAYLVLVDGLTVAEAAKQVMRDGQALLPQMVNNTVTRFKAAHTMICEVYQPSTL